MMMMMTMKMMMMIIIMMIKIILMMMSFPSVISSWPHSSMCWSTGFHIFAKKINLFLTHKILPIVEHICPSSAVLPNLNPLYTIINPHGITVYQWNHTFHESWWHPPSTKPLRDATQKKGFFWEFFPKGGGGLLNSQNFCKLTRLF